MKGSPTKQLAWTFQKYQVAGDKEQRSHSRLIETKEMKTGAIWELILGPGPPKTVFFSSKGH